MDIFKHQKQGKWSLRHLYSHALYPVAVLFLAGAVPLLASCGHPPGYTAGFASEPRKPLPALSSGFGQYLAGRQAQMEQNGAAAATFYRGALLHDPGNVELARRAWYYMLIAGRNDDAIALATATLPHDRANTLAPLLVATGAARDKKWQEALETLAPLKVQGLNSFVLPLMRAWILAGSGQTDQALDALAPMRKQHQLVPLHNFHAGLILDTADRNAEAGHWYAQILEDPSVSLRATQVIADYLRRNGKTEAALALFERYRRENRTSVLVDAALTEFHATKENDRPVQSAADGLAEALYGTASSVAQEKAWDAALVFSRMALIAKPDFAYAKLMIGDIFYEQRHWNEAVRILDTIAQTSPLFWPAQLKMAEALEQDNRKDDARNSLHNLAETYPDSPDPLMLLGDLERRQNNWPAAIQAYQNALNRSEKAGIPTWPAHYSLGMTLERNNQWDGAERHLLLALEQQPDHPMILNYLGYSWIDRGVHLERGQVMIEQAVALRPDDGFIIDSLGWARYLRGDYREAVICLERAAELEPADPTINDHLGDAYWKVGRYREAIFQWKRALSLEPEDSLAQSIKKKLHDHNGTPETLPTR